MTDSWSIGTTLIYSSDQYLRGDDGNRNRPLDYYAVVNLRTRLLVGKRTEFWTQIDNLFDTDYETAGIRNFNAFADPIAEQRFLAAATPRAGWVGIKIKF